MSSLVIATPEALAATSTDLIGIDSAIGAANAATASPTTGIVAAADEVSAAIAAVFGSHAREYQALSAPLKGSNSTGQAGAGAPGGQGGTGGGGDGSP